MHAGTSVERLLALSEGENQNARIYYWTKGINLFLDYPLQSIIFGNNGYYNSIYDNNPESGWICLLTDNGVIGFFFLSLAFIVLSTSIFNKQEVVQFDAYLIIYRF